jgi:FtsP/CotA-like multicopper oxidase with cupredoxin domain
MHAIRGDNYMDQPTVSRRNFLSLAGLAGVGVVTAACTAKAPAATPTMPGMDGTGATPAQGETYQEMDNLHKQGVEMFVVNIGKEANFWRAPLEFTLDGEVKVFEVTCTEGKWNVTPEQAVDAMMYNGMVPGPEIRVVEGDKVRVVCKNQMKNQSTSIHFHGVLVENKNDGVPFITQDPIIPGAEFTYEFTARNPGSHMYHSHHNAAEQVTKGLMGAFIIEPKDAGNEPQVDADYVMVLNDSGIGLTINGRGFPHTQPIVAKLGETIRVRYMNEGLLIHPMHLHGLPQQVIAKDGWPLASPYMCDTLNIAPGERWDVVVKCDEPGIWAYHCHILSHAESAKGMFGMVTALVIQ